MGAEKIREKITPPKEIPLSEEQRRSLGVDIRVLEKDAEGFVPDLEFIDGAKKLSFKAFLPEGVKLVMGKVFVYDSNRKVLYFNSLKLNSLFGVAALLHESGHAIDFADPEKHEENLFWSPIEKKVMEAVAKVITRDEFDRLPNRKEKARYINIEGGALLSENRVSTDQVSAYIRFRSRLERDAWAKGWKLYREIKKTTGIDLLRGFRAEDVISVSELALGTYSEGLGSLLSEEESSNLFLKKKLEELEAKSIGN